MLRRYQYVLIGFFSVVFIICCMTVCGYRFLYGLALFRSAGYEQQSPVSSSDGKYRLSVETMEYDDIPNGVDYIVLTIEDTTDASSAPVVIKTGFRDWDFHGVSWEYGTYHIWVSSSDVGTFCYRYQAEGNWAIYELHSDESGAYLFNARTNDRIQTDFPQGVHFE